MILVTLIIVTFIGLSQIHEGQLRRSNEQVFMGVVSLALVLISLILMVLRPGGVQ